MQSAKSIIIALASEKGGSGKSTCTVHLAAEAATEGYRALILDLDGQQSSKLWSDTRAREASDLPTVECRAIDPRHLDQELTRANSEGFDAVFLDTDPRAHSVLVDVMRAADIVLIPSQPTFYDLASAEKMAYLAEKMRANAVAVLNMCPPARKRPLSSEVREATLTQEAREALASYGLPVAPQALARRVGYSYALTCGASVSEFEPDSPGAVEIRALWNFAIENVFTRTTQEG